MQKYIDMTKKIQ